MLKIFVESKGRFCTGTVNLNAKSGLRVEYHFPLSLSRSGKHQWRLDAKQIVISRAL